MQTKGISPERGPEHNESTESKHLVVAQPEKFKGVLDTISEMGDVTEDATEDATSDWSTSGSASTTSDDTSKSQRAQAIAHLPSTVQMQKDLSKHIQKEIKVLRKQVRRKAFRASKKGSACQMNEMYGKIRRLNSLLAELMDSSVDVVKRIFIKVFIDKQSI